MAVKQNFLKYGYNYNDLYDTQDALDAGEISNVKVGTYASARVNKDALGLTGQKTVGGGDIIANKDNLGTLLGRGMDESIAAYKKKKLEQQGIASQGLGRSQSILGGSVV